MSLRWSASMATTTCVVGVSAAVAIIAITFGHRSFNTPLLEWDNEIVPLVQRYCIHKDKNTKTKESISSTNSKISNSSRPLIGRTIVITGATNGIGLALARAMSKLGGRVVALGRSSTKLNDLSNELDNVVTFQVDLENLEAVARTADQIVQSVDRIDILINNAGMHSGFDFLGRDSGVGTDPAYDKVFVVNYLAHFLLTEKLAQLLSASPQPVLVQTSSSFHWAVDGSDLLPKNANGTHDYYHHADTMVTSMPIAAQPGGSHGFIAFRSQRSYANTKLAQIYHARALKLYDTRFQNIRVVAFCPGWVSTGIARSAGPMSILLQSFGFPVEGWGISSAFHAIFNGNNTKNEENNKDDWYLNTKILSYGKYIIPTEMPLWMYSFVPLRDAAVGLFAGLALFTQHLQPYVGPSKSSPESYNQTKTKALYEWSRSAIAKYL